MSARQSRRARPGHDDVRRVILSTTARLYRERGYDGTNTDEIAALSSVSKRTLYRHFADKDELVRAAIKSMIDAAEAQGADAFDSLSESHNLGSDLRLFARQHIRDVIQPDIMKMRRRIIAEVDRFPEVAAAWYAAGPRRGHEKLATCFKRLRERGLLHIDDPELAAEQFNWLILSTPMNRAMFEADSVLDTRMYERYADEAVRVFLAAYGVEETRRDG